MDNQLQVINSEAVTLQEESPEYQCGNKPKNRLQNTGRTRWIKGQSGNPNGRPKSAEIRESVLERFNKNPSAVITKLYNERIDLFLAYGFGKPVDRLELSGPNGGQIEVHQTSAEDSVKALALMGIVLP